MINYCIQKIILGRDKVSVSNSVSNLIWVSGRYFVLDKGRQTYEETWEKFSNLRLKKKHF